MLPVSVRSAGDVWVQLLSERLSLAVLLCSGLFFISGRCSNDNASLQMCQGLICNTDECSPYHNRNALEAQTLENIFEHHDSQKPN